jgi:hypothetical protein
MKLIPSVSGISPWPLVSVAVLVAAVVLLAREWADSLRSQQDALAEEVRRGAEMDQRGRGFARRLEEKERLVQELLAGQLTLLEAAAYFRALDQAPPEFYWEAFRAAHAGDSDEERHCNEVITFVEAALGETDRGKADGICERLRAELRQHLQQGPLCLPALPPCPTLARELGTEREQYLARKK